ncbi:FAD-dependent oxidoreductase [Bradyrhizobium sp.]|uniref:FAD-dependent oxidoreductase n=1 Tax=Bradyrhizobium sp. TaxID=376 RepID=UPI0039C88EEA
MARILVLGAGFAGLWVAIGAARKREEIGARATDIEIVVVDRNPYHNIRVRNYEVDLREAAIPLTKLLDPVGVSHRGAEVEAIDPAARQVTVVSGGRRETVAYDRLVLALHNVVADLLGEPMLPLHSTGTSRCSISAPGALSIPRAGIARCARPGAAAKQTKQTINR